MDVLVLTIVGTLIGTVLAIEANAWMPHLSGWLVRRALAQMPKGLDQQMRSRWGEEIEGDLDSYSNRPLGGLIFAVGVACRGGRRLAAELMLEQALAKDPESAGQGLESDARGLKVTATQLKGGWQEVTYETSHGRRASRTVGPGDDVVDAKVLAELFEDNAPQMLRLEMRIFKEE